MTDKELLPCPFCGDTATFSEVYERDDSRYMSMDLDCCVTMRASIDYGSFKNMAESAIKAELTADLIERWNTRAAAEVGKMKGEK
jgi:hypothetical protein